MFLLLLTFVLPVTVFAGKNLQSIQYVKAKGPGKHVIRFFIKNDSNTRMQKEEKIFQSGKEKIEFALEEMFPYQKWKETQSFASLIRKVILHEDPQFQEVEGLFGENDDSIFGTFDDADKVSRIPDKSF